MTLSPRDQWSTTVLHPCLEDGTCVIIDRAAAYCRYDLDDIRYCNYKSCPILQLKEAKEQMHELSGAFKAMWDYADLKNCLYSLDNGTAYVKQKYHSDDIIRRDVND